ncbi:MAG: GNAT family protein [Gemmatimonadales bacterium]
MNPTPVVLYGEFVRLEPLDHAHVEALLEEAQSDDIWRYMPVSRPESADAMTDMVDRAWKAASLGHEIPFAIVSEATGRAVGSTRFLEIRRPDRALEIGWTWLGEASHRTAANTETKYLLLRHAFEDLGARRVQLKTDGRNERAQRAIERLGAKKEGVLRLHRLMWDGHVRDSVYYSVIADEWPEVKARLEGFLGR